MSDDAAHAWLLDQQPFDDADSEAQLRGLLAVLGSAPKRVLDLGCGVGRVLLPLVRAGHEVVGIDREPTLLESCAESLADEGLKAKLLEGDFLGRWPAKLGRFDAICCLGNTFVTVWDVDIAIEFLEVVVAHLEPGGAFVLDDLPHEYWPELIEGNWLSGISEDGQSQLVWASHDAVFTIRHGDAVDPKCWTIRASDTPLRLWTSGALRLAARLAGLSGPHCQAESKLLIMPLAGKRPRT